MSCCWDVRDIVDIREQESSGGAVAVHRLSYFSITTKATRRDFSFSDRKCPSPTPETLKVGQTGQG